MATYDDVANSLTPRAYWKLNATELVSGGTIAQFVNEVSGSSDYIQFANLTDVAQANLISPSLLKTGTDSPFKRESGFAVLNMNPTPIANSSFSFILKLNSINTSGGITKIFADGSGIGFGMMLKNNGTQVNLVVREAYGTETIINTLTVGQTYHIVITVTGAGVIHVYVDGVMLLTKTINLALSNTAKFFESIIRASISNFMINGYVLNQVNVDKLFTATRHLNINITGTIAESLIATDFIVKAHRADTSQLTAETTTNTSSFTLSVPDIPHYVTVLADQGTRHETEHVYAVGDKVFPTDTTAYPFYYECTVAGTTGVLEPVWNTATGSTIADNSVTWMLKEHLIQPVTHFPVTS